MAPSNLKTEKDALASFFVGELPRLLRYFTQRTGSRADGEDLTQETWIRLSRNSKKASRAPGPYLRRIMESVAIDFSRSRSRRLQDFHVALTPDLSVQAPTPEDAVAGRNELAALKLALAELPQRRREVFIRATLHGESCQKIASHYGLSKRTIEMDVKAALEHCAERLARGNS